MAWLVVLVIQGILPIATVYLTRALVNGLLAAIQAHGDWSKSGPLLVTAAAMGAVLLLGEILRCTSNWLREAQAERVRDYISDLIHQKSAAVDLAFYESPEFYDHLHRARAEATHRPIALIESLGSLLQNGITLAALLAVLIPFGLWLPAALVVSTLPALYVVMRYALLQHDWRLRTTAEERRTWYYDWLLTAGEAAAEIRLFGLQRHFRDLFQNLREKLRGDRLQMVKAQGQAEVIAGLWGIITTGAVLGWVGWRAVLGLVTLGDLALLYQAFQQGLGLTRSLLDHAGQLYQNTLFLGNLFEFLALEPVVINAPDANPAPLFLTDGICFRDVSFRYPGRTGWVLRHCNLRIAAGQVVTIVGPNGAGKSTLMKLLCRFYDPLEGCIEMDGQDLKSLELDDLRQKIAVLFQEPVQYSATVAENIALGDLVRKADRRLIVAAAQAAGAEPIVAKLGGGYDTLLGTWFEEGTELSLGEWQRVALARAFLRASPIVIFDEPTSAMDPWAESEWLSRFRKLVEGRTAIVITHRFTTAMFADAIHVMDRGEIVESGTHRELLAKGGLYAKAWMAQNQDRKPNGDPSAHGAPET
jgi:ATP-binding cassette, subfamily B, bacterial